MRTLKKGFVSNHRIFEGGCGGEFVRGSSKRAQTLPSRKRGLKGWGEKDSRRREKIALPPEKEAWKRGGEDLVDWSGYSEIQHTCIEKKSLCRV